MTSTEEYILEIHFKKSTAKHIVRGILLNVRAIIKKSNITLIVLIILVYQNEILEETCDVTIYWKITK